MKKNKFEIKNNSSKQFNVSNFNSEARDFPITRDELDFAYDFMKRHAPQDRKKEMLKELLSIQPFLSPLCENAYQNLVNPAAFNENQKMPFTGNTIPDIILTLASVYMPDTNLMNFDKKAQRQLMDIAKDVVSDFIEDREKFEETLESFPEPELRVKGEWTASEVNSVDFVDSVEQKECDICLF